MCLCCVPRHMRVCGCGMCTQAPACILPPVCGQVVCDRSHSSQPALLHGWGASLGFLLRRAGGARLPRPWGICQEEAHSCGAASACHSSPSASPASPASPAAPAGPSFFPASASFLMRSWAVLKMPCVGAGLGSPRSVCEHSDNSLLRLALRARQDEMSDRNPFIRTQIN